MRIYASIGTLTAEELVAQGRKSADDPAPLEPGVWYTHTHTRAGVKGKYYTTKNKYVHNNCGQSGHVR